MLRDTATNSTSENEFVPSTARRQVKTTIPAHKTVEFQLENDDLKHFGLQAGDVLIVRPGIKWEGVKPRQLCLLEHKSTGRRFPATIEVIREHIPGVPNGSHVYICKGMFHSNATYGKRVLTLLGEIVAFQRSIPIPE